MTTFAFGDQQQNTQSPFGGFNFGTSTSAPASSLLTQPATSNVLGTSTPFGGFGATSASAATTTPSLFGMTSTAPAFSTSLFPSSTTTSLGQTTASVTQPGGLSFGGFGNTASNSGLSFGTGSLIPASTTATVTTSTSVGLGGVDIQTSGALSGAGTANKKESKAVKESQIQNEIAVTVDSFKKYVKDQKIIREEMSRVSSSSIHKVQELVTTLKQQLSVVSNGLHRNAVAISRLKEESNIELKNAEISHRTKDSLSSLQYENNAPTEYFHNLATSFEKQMQLYRQQIEHLERHLMSLSQPYTLTSEEWTSNRRRLHDTFVTLAAHLQTVHQEVQLYKEHLIMQNLSQSEVKMYLDKCRVDRKEQILVKDIPLSNTYGPSPFAAMQSAVGKAITNAYNGSKFPGGAGAFGSASYDSGSSKLLASMTMQRVSTFQSITPFKPLGQPSFGVSSFGDSSSFGGDSSAQSQFGLNNQKPFQLQKPPAGNKRGKRWTST